MDYLRHVSQHTGERASLKHFLKVLEPKEVNLTDLALCLVDFHDCSVATQEDGTQGAARQGPHKMELCQSTLIPLMLPGFPHVTSVETSS